jgi:hypothetical protein
MPSSCPSTGWGQFSSAVIQRVYLPTNQQSNRKVYDMSVELVLLEVEITSDGFTLLRYKDAEGVTHMNFDNRSLERVTQIFDQANRKENGPLLNEGTGRRLVKLDVAMDELLKEEFGFNKVGAIAKA